MTTVEAVGILNFIFKKVTNIEYQSKDEEEKLFKSKMNLVFLKNIASLRRTKSFFILLFFIELD